jgi:hypothetical protein
MTSGNSLRRLPFLSAVFLITFSILIFQIAQTRILSVITWYHLAFFAITRRDCVDSICASQFIGASRHAPDAPNPCQEQYRGSRGRRRCGVREVEFLFAHRRDALVPHWHHALARRASFL